MYPLSFPQYQTWISISLSSPGHIWTPIISLDSGSGPLICSNNLRNICINLYKDSPKSVTKSGASFLYQNLDTSLWSGFQWLSGYHCNHDVQKMKGVVGLLRDLTVCLEIDWVYFRRDYCHLPLLLITMDSSHLPVIGGEGNLMTQCITIGRHCYTA